MKHGIVQRAWALHGSLDCASWLTTIAPTCRGMVCGAPLLDDEPGSEPEPEPAPDAATVEGTLDPTTVSGVSVGNGAYTSSTRALAPASTVATDGESVTRDSGGGATSSNVTVHNNPSDIAPRTLNKATSTNEGQ